MLDTDNVNNANPIQNKEILLLIRTHNLYFTILCAFYNTKSDKESSINHPSLIVCLLKSSQNSTCSDVDFVRFGAVDWLRSAQT